MLQKGLNFFYAFFFLLLKICPPSPGEVRGGCFEGQGEVRRGQGDLH